MKTIYGLKRLLGVLLATASAAMPVAAAPVTFTFSGQALNSGGGYEAGNAVSFTFTLRDYKPETLRVSPDPHFQQSACCGGSWGWYQDLWNQAHLWDEITGTGLTGSWNPVNTPAQTTTSALTVSLPHSPSNALNLNAFDLGGSLTQTGLFAHGVRVSGFEVGYSFLGLDVLKVIGDDQFSSPVPDPTELFSQITGHYAVDPIFSSRSRFWLFDPRLGTTHVDFKFTSVDINSPKPNAVPEPGTLWLLAGSGLIGLGGRCRLRRGAHRS